MVGYHKPVLLKGCVELLQVSNGWYVDCTLGDGGHSLEIIRHGGSILGIDVDTEALNRVKKRFKEEGISESRFRLVQGNFRDLKNLQTDLKFKGVLFDLGVSSLQLEDPVRGFSFLREGPLDMRMDPNLGVRAKDLIKVLNKGEIYELFTKLGEEKFAKRFSEALVRAGKIETTRDLALIAEEVYRSVGVRKWRLHPATKIFQALRVAVNDEINALIEVLPGALERLEENGRIVIISYHSLEDRVVKNLFKKWQEEGRGKVLTKKPIIPGRDEVIANPRSRSAKMRVFLKHDNST